MGRILFLLVAFIAVVFAVVLVAPGIIPTATYKPKLEAAASEALGREVSFSDDITLRILPRTAFEVRDLEIGNADGFNGDYLARVASADIGVRLIPLFSRSVEIERFVLTEPEINLQRAANGAVNWNLAEGRADAGDAESGAPAGDFRLGDVRIVDGAARYADAGAGKTYTMDDIDMTIVLTSLAEPLEARGTMNFQGQPSTIDMVLTSLRQMMNKEPVDLKLEVKVGETTAGADLKVETAEGLRYAGPMRFDAPNLPAFAALAGAEFADAPGFDRLNVEGAIDGGASAVRLTDARILFDDIDAQGLLSLDWAGAKPKVGGALSTDKLDLRPYMPPPSTSSDGFPEWSEAEMNFASLRNIDANLDISTSAIFINDLEMGESRLKLRLENGRMTADIPELAMYGGQGSGQLVINARGATPSFAGNFNMDAVQAQPLSLDLLKHDNLLGLGGFEFNFTAAGSSQKAIMSSMDGSGGFDLANGALKGVNIAGIVRGLMQFTEGFNPAALQAAVAEARGPSQTTDFTEFLSDFTITDGLVNAPTITMNGPYLRMTGRGNVNLPNQTIDIRLSPRGFTTIDGEGGRALTVPILVGGTFANPTIAIDAEALVRSGAERQFRNLLQGLGGQKQPADGDAEGAPADAAPEEQTPESAVRGLFENVLGGKKQPAAPAEPADDQDAAAEGETSLEETLINEGIGAIFGRKKPAEEPAQEPADDQ